MVTEPHAETEKSGPGDGELCFSQVSQVKTNDFWKVGTFSRDFGWFPVFSHNFVF